VHKFGKCYDSNPDLGLDLPILAQGLPAVLFGGFTRRTFGAPTLRLSCGVF